MASAKPFEITGLRVQNTHCRNFVFKNPTAPDDWDEFCREHDVSCTHEEIRAFIRERFDCILCREKLDKALYPFVDPIPTVVGLESSTGSATTSPNGGVVNLQVSFERHVDPVWTPLAVDLGAAVRLGFEECERLVSTGLAFDTSDPAVLEDQNRTILALVTLLVRTIHMVHRMQAVAVFDTTISCPVMTLIVKNTDLLMSLLHTQLGRARAEIATALGEASFEQCPSLTDVNTPYFAKWEPANPARAAAVRRILVDNNRKRLLHFRGWVTTTRACIAMPQFTTLATNSLSKWRFVDSEDFTVAQSEISDKSVYITAFELVLGCLAREPPAGCPLEIPTVHMDATMLDSRVNTAFNTCIAGYKRILATNQAQIVPSCFPLTATMKNEIESNVRRLLARFQAYETDFNSVIASMPAANKTAYTRAKLRFLHAHSIVNQGVVLRRLACLAKYLHDFAPILRGAECGDTGRCMAMVMAAVQYNKVATPFSEFAVARLERIFENDAAAAPATTASKKSKKKSKAQQKKNEDMRAVAPPDLKWTEVVTAQLPPLPVRAQPLSQTLFSAHTPIVTPTTTDDDDGGLWEQEVSGRRRKEQLPQQRRRRPGHGKNIPRVEYVIPTTPTVSTVQPVEPPTAPAVQPAEPPTAPAVQPAEIPTVSTVQPAEIPTVSTVQPVETPTVQPAEIPTVSTVQPAEIPTVLPVRSSASKRRERRAAHVQTRVVEPVMPPSTMQYLPQYIGIQGYDPSMYYMGTEPLRLQQASPPMPVAMCTPDGTVLYGHFLPQQLVYMPMIHF